MVCSQLAIALHSAQMNEKIAVERNNMQAVLNSITDLVLTLDKNGRLLICNHSLEKWLGIGDRELRTKSYIDWLGKYNEEIAQDISFVYSTGTELDRKDYNLIRVEADGSTSAVGTVNYSINPLRDASEEDGVVKTRGGGPEASSSSSSSASASSGEENSLRGVVISLQDITPTKQLLKKMGAYVNEHLVQQLVSDSENTLGGKRCEAVCLFSDIRSFTAISESMDPADTVEMLNSYFSLQVDAIRRFDGIIDKYIGDCIFAVFGVPIYDDCASLNACRAALGMREGLKTFNRLQAEKGEVELDIGVGLNTGKVVSGNIGSEARLEYTCIGDGVNLAARLEAMTKTYGVQILVSEFTVEKCKEHIVVRELDRVCVPGKLVPVTIFELVCLRKTIQTLSSTSDTNGGAAKAAKLTAKSRAASIGDEAMTKKRLRSASLSGRRRTRSFSAGDDLALFYKIPGAISPSSESYYKMSNLFAQGLALYRSMDFAAAADKFVEASTHGKDGKDKPSLLFKERCRKFMENPPTKELFNGGVWNYRSKADL